MNLNDDEDMLEMGADGLWSERLGSWLLEHDCHDIVTDMSFPQQLTTQNRDTENLLNKQVRVITVNKHVISIEMVLF